MFSKNCTNRIKFDDTELNFWKEGLRDLNNFCGKVSVSLAPNFELD